MTDMTNNTDTVPNPFSAPHVDRLFGDATDPANMIGLIPATRDFLFDEPIASQKRFVSRALLAREHFAQYCPPDAPVLPLSYSQREDLKIGGLPTVVALYARSLEGRDYDLQEHPTFFDYACGVMASEYNGYPGMKEDEQLRKRFPPRRLAGLGPGLCWQPPEQHARTMASHRRSMARCK